MPPYVPRTARWSPVSGAAEIVGGVAVLVRAARRLARWWNLALLVADLPGQRAHGGESRTRSEGCPTIPRWLLWARLPFQAVFMAWAVRATPTSD